MGLYQNYRPSSFEEVIGNEEIVAQLQNWIEKDKLPHALLFAGPTGCGKTTFARIIAKELGVTGNDFMELDSADFRGIDTIRRVREQSRYLPTKGKYRVFLLDECHKLTSDAQGALLKALEDTPEHVYFILATTDPDKLLKTIRGRLTTFEVKLLTERQMLKLLKRTVRAEKQIVSREVLEEIIEKAEGHPRNALQLLEQVLQVSKEEQLAFIQSAIAEKSESIELCRALLNGSSWKKVSNILKGLRDQDSEGVRRHVLAYASSVLLGKDNDQAALVIEEFSDNFWNSGYAGLVYASYSVIKG